ncbi:cupin domain-containing protein [Ralstonia pseudosolanacearum]|uniref:cupin domain-containing protein n=1 Tax=Ralstonia pseudosolanacearum TaxID=1310165 RepID=UPI003CF62A3D
MKMKGAMFGPYHNTRSATIAMVQRGIGFFQIACPHLSQQQGASYNASAKLLDGDVFVVPAAHPVVIVNYGDENLKVLYFEVNAQGNQRIPLAGMNNVLKQLGKEAKQLSFNMSSKQVDDILDKQKESWFFPGPGQRSERAST